MASAAGDWSVPTAPTVRRGSCSSDLWIEYLRFPAKCINIYSCNRRRWHFDLFDSLLHKIRSIQNNTFKAKMTSKYDSSCKILNGNLVFPSVQIIKINIFFLVETLYIMVSAPVLSDTGCIYNKKKYLEGQSWAEGCSINCTCVNGRTGQYKCEDT